MLISRPSLAVGKFRDIHQSVKSFDKHGDISPLFSPLYDSSSARANNFGTVWCC